MDHFPNRRIPNVRTFVLVHVVQRLRDHIIDPLNLHLTSVADIVEFLDNQQYII
jgi:hypothetical protein